MSLPILCPALSVIISISVISAIMEGLGKDSRSRGNFKARRTVHHRSGTFNGPDVISKKQIGSQKTPFSSTTSDPFGVNDFNVTYSLNKQKRWEAVDRPADVMQKKLDVERLSFISTSVPRTSGRLPPIDSIPLDMENLNKCGGGVVRFVTCVNGEVTDRKSKKKAHFKSLLEQPGPGPQPREKKQLREEEKNRKRIERSMKGISNENLNLTETEKIDPEIQYTAMTLYHQRSSEAESMWRKHQSVFRANAKKASARNRRLGENIYESDSDQDALEDELERKYSKLLIN